MRLLRQRACARIFVEGGGVTVSMFLEANLLDRLHMAIARVYNGQQTYTDLTHDILQAMYLRPPNENLDAFLSALAVYLGDIVLNEPRLLTMYDALLPQIDRAVGDSVDEQAAPR